MRVAAGVPALELTAAVDPAGATGGRAGPSPICVRGPEARAAGNDADGEAFFACESGRTPAADPGSSFVDRFTDGPSSLSTPEDVAGNEASASLFAVPGKSLEKMLIAKD